MVQTLLRNDLNQDGFAIYESVFSDEDTDWLVKAIERIEQSNSVRKRAGVFAIRNLLDFSPEIRALANSAKVRKIIEPVLGLSCFAVRGTLFDKIPDANWKVPWHQDLTIAVQEKIDVDGYGPWSVKAGIQHTQPPAEILEQMLSVRIHLDRCGEENGALRVIPGSHLRRRIPEEQISDIRNSTPEQICAAGRGSVLLMRPLLLHASSSSNHPGHRRVIHLDFAATQLADGLKWYSEIVST